MSLRRRSSSKPSSSRGCNKVRILNRQDVAEIESWVDFASQNNSNDEDEIGFQSLNKKNPKNLFMLNVKEWRKDM